MGNLGWGSLWTGDYAGAEFSFLEALRLSQQMGKRDIHAHSLIALGCCHFLNGRLEEAQETAAEGAKIAKDIMNPLTEAYGLAILSMRSSLDGDYKLGQHLASESLDKVTNLTGDLLGHWAQATACVGLGQTEQAWQQAQSALKIGFKWRWYGTMTWVLPVVGIILGQAGQPKRAAEILGLYFNHPARPVAWAEKRPLLREWITRLEESLGADEYRSAWERGKGLDLMTAVEALLAEE